MSVFTRFFKTVKLNKKKILSKLDLQGLFLTALILGGGFTILYLVSHNMAMNEVIEEQRVEIEKVRIEKELMLDDFEAEKTELKQKIEQYEQRLNNKNNIINEKENEVSRLKKRLEELDKKVNFKLSSRGGGSSVDANVGNEQIFEVTAYTSGYESTGKTPSHPAYGITASGAKVKEGRTIACPREIEFGTKIHIPYFNNTFTCEDRGGAITSGKLDVYMNNLSEAQNFGRRSLKVNIIK